MVLSTQVALLVTSLMLRHLVIKAHQTSKAKVCGKEAATSANQFVSANFHSHKNVAQYSPDLTFLLEGLGLRLMQAIILPPAPQNTQLSVSMVMVSIL